MRKEERQLQKIEKKNKAKLRLEKAVVFLLTFYFVIGLVTVDQAYSEMLGKPGALSLQTSRIDRDRVIFSLLGEEVTINVTDVKQTIDQIEDGVVEVLEDVSVKARELLNIPAWPRKELHFQSKIL